MTDTTQFGEVAPTETAPVQVTDENLDKLFEEQKNEEVQTKEATKEEVKEETKEEPKVNLGALHEERARRKALQAELKQVNERLAQEAAWRQQNETILQERLAAMQQNRPQIDPNENPVQYLSQKQEETQKMLADFQKRQEEQDQRVAQERSAQQISQYVEAEERRFATEKPDYLQAVGFAKEFKAKEYRTFGYSEEQIAHLVNADAVAIVQRALQIGESPANMAYQYALSVGFKPQVNAEKKLDMMEAGQKAAKPSSGGSKDTGTLSLEQLASMSDDDFGKITDAQFRKLMGG